MEKITFDAVRSLPYAMCVYAVFNSEECLYVGSTNNARRRFYRHHKMSEFIKHNAQEIQYLTIDDEFELIEHEREWIRRHRPTLNSVANRKPSTTIHQYHQQAKERLAVSKFTTFRDRVHKLMLHRRWNLNLTQIAKDCEISLSWLQKFQSGKIPNPGACTLERLESYLLEFLSLPPEKEIQKKLIDVLKHRANQVEG